METSERFDEVCVNPLPPASVTPISLADRLREVETGLIRWALDASNGNKSKAALLLNVKRSTLGDRIRHCGLDRHQSPHANDTMKMAVAR